MCCVSVCVVAVAQVVSGDVVQEAIQFAQSVAHKPLEGRITSKMPVRGAEQANKLREGSACH